MVACCWEQRVHADRVQRVLPDGHADVLLYGSGEVEVVGVYDHVALRARAPTRVRHELAVDLARGIWRRPSNRDG